MLKHAGLIPGAFGVTGVVLGACEAAHFPVAPDAATAQDVAVAETQLTSAEMAYYNIGTTATDAVVLGTVDATSDDVTQPSGETIAEAFERADALDSEDESHPRDEETYQEMGDKVHDNLDNLIASRAEVEDTRFEASISKRTERTYNAIVGGIGFAIVGGAVLVGYAVNEIRKAERLVRKAHDVRNNI